MVVRCKFRFVRMETQKQMVGNPWREELTHTLYFEPVTGDGTPENKEFWKWTPAGEFRFSTINHEAAKQFEFGKEYYVDFTPAHPTQGSSP
jgi:hypothetical protein